MLVKILLLFQRTIKTRRTYLKEIIIHALDQRGHSAVIRFAVAQGNTVGFVNINPQIAARALARKLHIHQLKAKLLRKLLAGRLNHTGQIALCHSHTPKVSSKSIFSRNGCGR